MIKQILFIFLLGSAVGLQAQNDPIFPDLEEEDLLNALVNSYRPSTVLDYGDARDIMYGTIDRRNDSVYCIYSGHRVYLPDWAGDPSQYIYQGGDPDGINAEHSYPRSKGADVGNPYSDMHHLYPARVAVNTARDVLPFAEIVDTQTKAWYYRDGFSSTIPSSNIDAYSEKGATHFEVRESHKGNIARSIFYFYTMYKIQADAADSNYFWQQLNTLCKWHSLDPVDEEELARTYAIAEYQSGKVNPFVLDCSLVERAYGCTNPNPNCMLSSIEKPTPYAVEIYPNPTTGQVELIDKQGQAAAFKVYTMQGQEVLNLSARTTISLDNLKNGLYWYQIFDKNGFLLYTDKLVLLR